MPLKQGYKMKYLKFDKNFKTDRRWKIISIGYRQLNGINIDPKRLNYDSLKSPR